MIDLANLDLPEIIGEIAVTDCAREPARTAAIYRRLVDLACFTRGLTGQDRAAALRLAFERRAELVATLVDRPKERDLFVEAADMQEDEAAFRGVGSLHWIIQERGIQGLALFGFITRPEFVSFCPIGSCCSMMG